LLVALVSACQAPPADRPVPETPSEPAAPAWPGFDYGSPAVKHPAYRLDTAGSRLDVVVRREGPLARFGHDHVVSVQGLEGFVLLDESGAASRADLRFRLEDLAIDTAEGRARYQLDTVPDANAIEGTRANLMERVLDAGQWPLVTVRLDDFSFLEEHHSAMVTVTINGAHSSSRQPFRLQSSDETVRVESSLVLRQTDLGLEPFSALGGGLRVADALEIHVRLTGTRLAGLAATATRWPGAAPLAVAAPGLDAAPQRRSSTAARSSRSSASVASIRSRLNGSISRS
jgi:hypothetical protein